MQFLLFAPFFGAAVYHFPRFQGRVFVAFLAVVMAVSLALTHRIGIAEVAVLGSAVCFAMVWGGVKVIRTDGIPPMGRYALAWLVWLLALPVSVFVELFVGCGIDRGFCL